MSTRDLQRRRSLSHRVRYRFDNMLARGTWAALVWLGIVTLAVVLVSAVVLTIFNVSFTSDEGSTVQEDFWQSLLRVMDPGTMAGDVGWGRRILALLVTLFGLLVAGTLIGILAAGVEDRITSMRRGRSVVMEEGHVVVLGPPDRPAAVVAELLRGGVGGRAGVVAMAEQDPTEMRDAVRRLAEGHLRSRLVVRSGDPTLPGDLELVRLETARSIVIVGDDDGWVTRVVLAVAASLGPDSDIPITVEVGDAARAQALVDAVGPELHTLATELALARIAAFAVSHPGLTHVVEELIDPGAAQLQVVAVGQHHGRTFGEVVMRSTQGRPVGVIDRLGEITLAPELGRALDPTDQVILLSAKGARLELDDLGSDDDLPTSHRASRPSPQPQHLLVLGATPFARTFLAGWASSAPKGSSLSIVVSDGRVPPPELTGSEVDVTVLDRPRRSVLDDVADGSLSPTTIVLVASEDDTPTTVDGATILDLMTLERQLPPGALRPQIVIELVDPHSGTLLPHLLPDDHVVSRSLGAQMLAQLADDPTRRGILLALSSPTGPGLAAVAPSELDISATLMWREVVGRCCAAGLVPLGWTGPTRTRLDPAPTAGFDPGDDVRIVVVV